MQQTFEARWRYHSPTVSKPAVKVLAENLRSAMQGSQDLNSQTAVAKKAGIAQTAVGYMLNPDKRQPTKSGKLPSPTLDQIERVARAMGMEPWELLYTGALNRPLRESERIMYQRIASVFQSTVKKS